MNGTCLVHGCRGSRLFSHLLVCGRHWYSVPAQIRHDVWAAYLDQDPGAGHGGYGLAAMQLNIVNILSGADELNAGPREGGIA